MDRLSTLILWGEWGGGLGVHVNIAKRCVRTVYLKKLRLWALTALLEGLVEAGRFCDRAKLIAGYESKRVGWFHVHWFSFYKGE